MPRKPKEEEKDKPHRKHGEGSYRQKPNGTWICQATANGRRVNHVVQNEAAALKWLRETRVDADRDLLPVDTAKVTVGAFLNKWLAVTSPSIRPKTIELYEGVIRLHLLPRLGKLRLSGLRADHLQTLYAEKLRAGLSPRTVQIIHRTMRRALVDAVKWKLVIHNVADAATAPKPRKPEIQAWNPTGARMFLDGVAGARLEPLYRLAIHCGVRQGELLGLHWDDLDIDSRRLQIRRTLRRVGKNGVMVGEPKSSRGRRQIVLSPSLIESLHGWRAQQLQDRLLAGDLWKETGYLFTSKVGTAIEQTTLLRDFYAQMERLGLPRIAFHGLRHTCATLLFSQGVHPKQVQELLGHSSISLTLDTYSHLLPTMQDQVADTMEKLLAGT